MSIKEFPMNQIFTVEGMTCGHCEKAVRQALQALDAQAKITIDRQQQRVEVDSPVARDALVKAITEEGYRVLA
jgi:copper chaperone